MKFRLSWTTCLRSTKKKLQFCRRWFTRWCSSGRLCCKSMFSLQNVCRFFIWWLIFNRVKIEEQSLSKSTASTQSSENLLAAPQGWNSPHESDIIFAIAFQIMKMMNLFAFYRKKSVSSVKKLWKIRWKKCVLCCQDRISAASVKNITEEYVLPKDTVCTILRGWAQYFRRIQFLSGVRCLYFRLSAAFLPGGAKSKRRQRRWA